MEGLLRGDSQARAEFLSKMVDHGIYQPNEARAYEDKAPRPGGDQLIVNGTMQRLDQVGQSLPANDNGATQRNAGTSAA